MRLLAAVAAAILAVAGLALVVLSGTAGASFPRVELDETRALPQGGVYRSPVTEPPSLNPFTMRDAVAALYVLAFTHDALVDRDPGTGAARAAAAESWSVSDDGLTVTFRLREDLVFADGAPVGREDLEFTLATCCDPRLEPKSDMAFALAELAGAEAPDHCTVILQLVEPRARPELALGGLLRIAQKSFFVDAVGALDPAGADPTTDAFFAHLPEVVRCGPGTGPLAEQEHVIGTDGWEPGSHLNLLQNPHCWRLRAQPRSWNLAGLQHRFLLDEAVRLAAARTGQVDWFVSQAGTDLAELQRSDEVLARDFVLHAYDPAHIGHYFVLWNCRKPPLANPAVRRALAMLLDRRAIQRDVFGGRAHVAKGWFKPGMDEYPDAWPDPPFAPRIAAEILAAEGYGRGGEPLRIELLCATVIPTLRRIAERAHDAFREAGVELVVQPMDYGAIYERQMKKSFDAILWLQTHEPVIDPYDFFASEWNDMGYSNPEMERVLLAARATDDPGERVRLYTRFHEILRDEQPITLLVHPSVQVLLHRRFQEALPGPLGLFPERWWVKPADRLVR